MLSTKNLRQRRPSRKLANKYEGPFQITKVVGSHGLAYQLRLPSSLRMHSTFPISSLEPYRGPCGERPSSPVTTALQAQPAYEVEAILDHKGKGRSRQYLIKWKDYDVSENSWEPRRNLDDGPLIKEYLKSIGETSWYLPQDVYHYYLSRSHMHHSEEEGVLLSKTQSRRMIKLTN